MVFVVNIHLQRFLTLPSQKFLLYVISGSFSLRRGRADKALLARLVDNVAVLISAYNNFVPLSVKMFYQ